MDQEVIQKNVVKLQAKLLIDECIHFPCGLAMLFGKQKVPQQANNMQTKTEIAFQNVLFVIVITYRTILEPCSKPIFNI